MPTPHVDDNDAARLFTDQLSDADRARIDEHVDTCSDCRRFLAELARASELGASDDAPLLGSGEAVGRYLVDGVLGAGAMGVVYAAVDPQLQRRVAVKLVRPRSSDIEKARARLLLEAQSLAKLSHPNVVQVYDAGEWSGSVFIALELVRGGTLTEWLASERQSAAAIVAVFREAGAGLAAAHAAGIVHRDFKPDNVLVGEDGRVRVTDFGLAAASGDGSEADETVAARSPAPPHPSLTTTGALLGTPRYMAPELRDGAGADARSDQYSFACALDEALRGAAVARSVRRAIDRALSPREARYASMVALLGELAWDPSVRSRRLVALAGGVVVLASTAFAVAQASGARVRTGGEVTAAPSSTTIHSLAEVVSLGAPGCQTAVRDASPYQSDQSEVTSPTNAYGQAACPAHYLVGWGALKVEEGRRQVARAHVAWAGPPLGAQNCGDAWISIAGYFRSQNGWLEPDVSLARGVWKSARKRCDFSSPTRRDATGRDEAADEVHLRGTNYNRTAVSAFFCHGPNCTPQFVRVKATVEPGSWIE